MDLVISGVRAFPLPAGAIMTLRQGSPGATGVAALASQDGATGFTSAALTNSTPVTIGPFAADAVINVMALGAVAVDVIAASAVNISGGAISGASVAATTLSASGAVTLSPAGAAVSLSPTGAGVVTINPATAGTMNNVSVGVTTPAVVKTSNLQAGTFTDISGTPGAGTSNGTRGRAAFAAAASTIVVTNALVAATSSVFVQLEGAADATLTSVLGVTLAAGSFTVTGNAVATAAKTFSFLVIN